MWLAGFEKKNVKDLSSKTFLAPKMFFKKARKIIEFSEAEVAANFEINPRSIY